MSWLQHPSAFTWLLPLVLLLGLGLSFAFRRRSWVVFIWFPTTATFVYIGYQISKIFSSLGKMSGPEAGYAGLMTIFLLPVLALCIGGLIAAFFCRPRKNAWQLSTAFPAVIFWLAVALIIDRSTSSLLTIQLFNTAGTVLADVRVNQHIREFGLKMAGQVLKSDASGKFAVRLRPGQSVALEIQPMARIPGPIHRQPTFWNLGITELPGNPDKWILRHHWQRSIGGQTLNEAFSEVVPKSANLQIQLVLPEHGALDPEPREQKIRAAFDAFLAENPTDIILSSLCRNVEAIAFIPELLALYQGNQANREDIVEGLSQIASMLAELNRAYLTVERSIAKRPTLTQQDEWTQFCIWAQVPPSERNNSALAAAKVRAKIDTAAHQLTAFALEHMHTDPRSLEILSRLEKLATPAIPALIEAVITLPPGDIKMVYNRSRALRRIGAQFSDLQLLYASNHPLIVMTAFEATPNEQVEGAVAAEALARLEAVYSRLPDNGTKQRADMHLNLLRARLE